MTENDYKRMLRDILTYETEYEYLESSLCEPIKDSDWKRFNLFTNTFHEDWKYRKVEFWYVTENANKLVVVDEDRIKKWYGSTTDENVLFVSKNKEDCKKWINGFYKNKYRPFRNTTELIETYYQKLYELKPTLYEDKVAYNSLEMADIWVKSKKELKNHIASKITDFTEDEVEFSYGSADMEYLFENYVFLDESICGVMVEQN